MDYSMIITTLSLLEEHLKNGELQNAFACIRMLHCINRFEEIENKNVFVRLFISELKEMMESISKKPIPPNYNALIKLLLKQMRILSLVIELELRA